MLFLYYRAPALEAQRADYARMSTSYDTIMKQLQTAKVEVKKRGMKAAELEGLLSDALAANEHLEKEITAIQHKNTVLLKVRLRGRAHVHWNSEPYLIRIQCTKLELFSLYLPIYRYYCSAKVGIHRDSS